MKNTAMIFLGALVIFMMSCSEYIAVTGPQTDEDAWVTDISLPVPIVLGTDSNMSKAVINELEDMHQGRFGIFAVDKDSPTVNALMLNEQAYFAYDSNTGSGRFKFGEVGNSVERVKYYPRESKQNYNFYAYYKRGGEKMHLEDTKVSMDVLLFRTNDVLWGKAEAEVSDGLNGFNEKYVRNTGRNVSFDFSHPAAALAFSVSAADNLRHDSNPIFSVTSLTFHEVTTKAKLCVVDCEKDLEKNVEGQFYEVVETETYPLYAKGGATPTLNVELSNATPPGNQYQIGDVIFIMPQTDPIKCVLHVRHKVNGSEGDFECYLHPSMINENLTGYEAGKIYRYNFVIGRDGPRPILKGVTAGNQQYDSL